MQMPIIFVFTFVLTISYAQTTTMTMSMSLSSALLVFASLRVSPFKHSTAISNKLDQFKIHRNLTFLSRTHTYTQFSTEIERKKESKTWPHIERAWMAEIAYRRFLISRSKYFFVLFFKLFSRRKKTVQQHSCIRLNLELRTNIYPPSTPVPNNTILA